LQNGEIAAASGLVNDMISPVRRYGGAAEDVGDPLGQVVAHQSLAWL
jgi:hypothetical protein